MKQDVYLDGQRFKGSALLMEEYEISRPVWYRWVKSGLLPKPVKLGGTRLFNYDEVGRALSRGEQPSGLTGFAGQPPSASEAKPQP